MKKIVVVLLSLLMMSCLCSCAKRVGEDEQETKYTEHFDIVLITDTNSLYDDGINEYTYKAISSYCEANSLTCNYLQLESDTEENKEVVLSQALDDFSANVIISNCNDYNDTLINKANNYNDVKFVTVNSNLEELGNIANFNVEVEAGGYIVGYALVLEGYTELGYLSNKENTEYLYGFIEGAEKAAEELNTYVSIDYTYADNIESLDKEISNMYDYVDVIYVPDEYEDNVIKIADTLEKKYVVCTSDYDFDCVLFNSYIDYKKAVTTLLNLIYTYDFEGYKGTTNSLGLKASVGAVNNTGKLINFTNDVKEKICNDETYEIEIINDISELYLSYVTVY